MNASRDAGVDGERTSVMTTDQGRISLTMPEHLTEADVDDFSLWIELVKRTMRRSVITDAGRRALEAETRGGRDGE